jgi:uncharacterized protein (DUF3084 family)
MTPDQINRQSRYVQEAFVQLLDERNNAHNRAQFYHAETKKLTTTVITAMLIIAVMGGTLFMMNNKLAATRLEASHLASQLDDVRTNAQALGVDLGE